MEMPRPGAPHAAIARFAGHWSGTERMLPSPWCPEEVVADATIRNRMALGGFVLVSDYEQRQGDTVTYEGHGVHTWEAATARHVMYWFDSLGGAPNLFRGTFEGELLPLTSEESTGEGPRLSRVTYDLSVPGELRSCMEMSPDGTTWNLFMEGHYHRR